MTWGVNNGEALHTKFRVPFRGVPFQGLDYHCPRNDHLIPEAREFNNFCLCIENTGCCFPHTQEMSRMSPGQWWEWQWNSWRGFTFNSSHLGWTPKEGRRLSSEGFSLGRRDTGAEPHAMTFSTLAPIHEALQKYGNRRNYFGILKKGISSSNKFCPQILTHR